MIPKPYKYVFSLVASVLLAYHSYGLQIDTLESAEIRPLDSMPIADSINTRMSTMRMKLQKLNRMDWQKQTLAMQKSFKKLQEKMGDLGDRIQENVTDGLRSVDNRSNNDNIQDDGDIAKIKTYSKTYPADANDELNLSNSYGRITVNTWSRNEVKVDVQIKVYANDNTGAEKALNTVTIDDSKEGNTISFKTNINRSFSSWNWSGSRHNKVEINYVVYMPARLQLDVKNNYGNIILPDLSGEVRVHIAYSNLTAQNLSNPLSEISGSYGNVKVGSFNGGRLSLAYGNIDVEEVNNLKANVSYGSVSLGRLKGRVGLSLAYLGSLRIGEIDDDLKALTINSSYSSLNLGVSNKSNFSFDVNVTYASFKYDDNVVNITNQTPEPGSRGYSPTKTYRGTFGKGNPSAQVNITSAYGSVKFD